MNVAEQILEFDNSRQNFFVGLSWEENPDGSHFSVDHDLDLSCILLDKKLTTLDVVMPSCLKRDKYRLQIFHSGDHRTGSSSLDDEEIHINLKKLDPDICHVAFVVSLKSSNLSFSDIKNPFCIFADGSTYRKYLSIDLREYSGSGNRVVLTAILNRKTGKNLDADDWSLIHVGHVASSGTLFSEPLTKEIVDIVKRFFPCKEDEAPDK